MDAAPLASRATSNPSFVGFDMPIWHPANPVLIRADHPGPQLVEHQERRFVAADAKLSLKLNGGHARRLAGHQVGCPEPDAQGHVRVLHDSPHRQPRLPAAFAATENPWASACPERFTGCQAMGADKSLRPAGLFQIGRARRVIREHALKFRERPGK